MIVNRQEKSDPRFRRGLVNPDSSTDRNPDRSSTDDAADASGATDIRRVAVVSVARVILGIVIRFLVRRADVNAEAFIRS